MEAVVLALDRRDMDVVLAGAVRSDLMVAGHSTSLRSLNWGSEGRNEKVEA